MKPTFPLHSFYLVSIALAFTSCASPATQPGSAESRVPQAQPPSRSLSQSSTPRHLFSRPSGLTPRGVTSFGAASTDTHVYTLGGYFGIAHQYSKEGQHDAFERMDLATGKWEALPSPGPVQSATLTEYQGRLYRVGGLAIHNAEGEPQNLESLSTVERFDPAKGQWEALTPLPAPRSSHEVALVGNELWVVGGWRLSGEPSSGQWDDALYVANLDDRVLTWRRVAASFRLRALGLAALGHRLISVGGIDANSAAKAVHYYDTQANTWSQGPDYPEPGFGVRAITLNGSVIASGASGVVYTLDEANRRWVQIGSLAFRRAFHQIVSGPNSSAMVLGGTPGMRRVDRIRHIETLTFDPPPSAVTRWQLPAPGPAKNRQGVFLSEDQLYLFGGNNSLEQHDFAKDNFLSEGHRLDLGSLSWKPLTSFPVAQQSMQTLIAEDGKGLAVGGFGMVGGDLKTRPDIYRFDFEGETWSKVERGLPQARTQFGLTEYDGQFWIFGGLDFDDTRSGQEQFVHPLEVLSADSAHLDRGFSDSGLRIPRPRRAFAGTEADGRYYLIGGMAAGFQPVTECDVFDFASRAWSTVACPERTRIGAEIVAHGNRIFLAAGRSVGLDGKLGPDKSIEIFDIEKGHWSIWLEELPMQDTHQMRMLPFGERLLVYSAQQPEANVELLLIDPTNALAN